MKKTRTTYPANLLCCLSLTLISLPRFSLWKKRSTRIETLNLGEVLFSRPFSSSPRLSLSRRTPVKESPVEEGLPRVKRQASEKRYNFSLYNCLTSFPARDLITTQGRTSWSSSWQRETESEARETLFAFHSSFSVFPASRSQFSPSFLLISMIHLTAVFRLEVYIDQVFVLASLQSVRQLKFCTFLSPSCFHWITRLNFFHVFSL